MPRLESSWLRDRGRPVISGRDQRRGDEAVTRIRAAGGKADFVPADLAGDAGSVRDFAARATAAAGGRVDILVNNAGIYPATSTPELSDADSARAACASTPLPPASP